MPVISRYGCNECEFEFPSGWGGYTYAVDDSGRRVVCGHPGEFDTIWKVTGLSYTDACDAGRTGFAQHCVCSDCLEQFDLDVERDRIVCPKCTSPQVRSLRESIGHVCPRCKVGMIEEGSLVRWKLDLDWETLPVPQVVKHLLDTSEQRKVPISLQQAAEIADGFGDDNFSTVVVRLLGWWEGDYFSEDQEQKDSAEMKPQWTWCKALPAVLRATPALAELVVIRDGRYWFVDGILPDVRRGIKNYLRKHRTHWVMS